MRSILVVNPKGGCGKTHDMINRNIKSPSVFTTNCWILITDIANKYKIRGLTTNRLTGSSMSEYVYKKWFNPSA